MKFFRAVLVLAAQLAVLPAAAGPCDSIRPGFPPETYDLLRCIAELRARIDTLEAAPAAPNRRLQIDVSTTAAQIIVLKQSLCILAGDIAKLRRETKLPALPSEETLCWRDDRKP